MRLPLPGWVLLADVDPVCADDGAAGAGPFVVELAFVRGPFWDEADALSGIAVMDEDDDEGERECAEL